jgi:hypothetical protein
VNEWFFRIISSDGNGFSTLVRCSRSVEEPGERPTHVTKEVVKFQVWEFIPIYSCWEWQLQHLEVTVNNFTKKKAPWSLVDGFDLCLPPSQALLIRRKIIYSDILIFKFAERRCESKQINSLVVNLIYMNICDMTAESWNSETRRVGHC